MGKRNKLLLPSNATALDKLLAHLDAKTLTLLVAMLGSNGAWALKPEAPSIPADKYTAVVTMLTQERAAAEIARDKMLTAKKECQDALLKRHGNRPAAR